MDSLQPLSVQVSRVKPGLSQASSILGHPCYMWGTACTGFYRFAKKGPVRFCLAKVRSSLCGLDLGRIQIENISKSAIPADRRPARGQILWFSKIDSGLNPGRTDLHGLWSAKSPRAAFWPHGPDPQTDNPEAGKPTTDCRVCLLDGHSTRHRDVDACESVQSSNTTAG